MGLLAVACASARAQVCQSGAATRHVLVLKYQSAFVDVLCAVLCCAVLQIVDMELPEGQSVLGARLVQVLGGGGSSGAAQTVLLLLTQSQIVCYQLKAPA
jgi:hypothetical protein